MSYVSLSGLSAAQLDLNTTSNNIANANTYGFKESRAEFGDVYSNSLFTNAKTTPGGGAQANVVAQQFHEGSSIYTNNPMDLRISGTGFFAVAKDVNTPQQNELTRNGAFHLNKDNMLVTSNDEFLLGYKVNKDSGQVESYEAKPIEVKADFGVPKETETVEIGANLPATPNKEHNPANFNFSDEDTYDRSTSFTVNDSQGNPYKMTTYYLKSDQTPNTWHAYYTITDAEGEKPLNIEGGDADPGGTDPHVGHTLKFNNDGSFNSVNSGNPVASVALGTEANIDLQDSDPDQTISMKLGDHTSYAAPFEITKLDEDGAKPGFLTKVDFDEEGNVMATYSNGKNENLGRVALVRVANEQGLDKKGGTQWDSTSASGEKIWGESNKGSFGTVNNGTLEQSNIDMTQELVDLISAQRNFQANSRALDVHNQLQQNILQIR
ncbi:flagellar hook protein FlgE [Vibrio wakamikoensis]|uniref:flagellar hook protein FlgE n=1 Tax=Vibrio wakamikoensis TaxID=2910251 RepID=UPI003D26160B